MPAPAGLMAALQAKQAGGPKIGGGLPKPPPPKKKEEAPIRYVYHCFVEHTGKLGRKQKKLLWYRRIQTENELLI